MKRLIAMFFLCLLSGFGSFVAAAERFDEQLRLLASEDFSTREAATKALYAICIENPSVIDVLLKIAIDPEEDVERVARVNEVIRAVFFKKVFVERGVLGIQLSEDYRVVHVVDGGPAHQAGMQVGWRMTTLGGIDLAAKSMEDVYRIIHDSKPGEVLEVELVKPGGGLVVLRPVVAARSTVRDDENVTLRREKSYQEWLERKREGVER